MKLEQSFEIDAPLDQVWTALLDLEQVAPCLPGATVTGHDEDGTYHGTFTVKLGPTTASYRGTIKVESADVETHTATLVARGTDKRGQGGANATIVNTLHPSGAGTRVEAVTDMTITGRLASFGRVGIMKDISNRLMGDFAACLAQKLAAQPSGELTAEEAAASAGAADMIAEGAPEVDVEGKSPAEVSRARAAAGAGEPAPAGVGEAAADAPAAAPPAGAPDAGTPPPAAAPQRQTSEPPAAAEPIKAVDLIVSILREKVGALWQRLGRWLRARL